MSEPQTRRTSRKQVAVLFLRHGEREDEAEQRKPNNNNDKQKKQRSIHEIIDPPLTLDGYRQARAAFVNLERALFPSEVENQSRKRVTIVCSPLRRTVGTAAMSGAVDWRGNHVDLDLPVTRDEANKGSASAPPVPIVVMNGLCDPAAHVVRIGGASKAVAGGLVRCAATPGNDYRTSTQQTPLLQVMSEMMSVARPTLAEGECRGKDIQLWREAGYEYRNHLPSEDDFVPMTQQVSLNDIPHCGRTPKIALCHPTKKGDDFLSTINRAAYLSATSGCDVSIVVTHREAIRFMAKHVCGYHPPHKRRDARLSTPDCCIAAFDATVSYTTPCGPCRKPRYSVKWTFHGVTPYEKFRTACLPPLQFEQNLPISETTEVNIAIPGEPIHIICAINSSVAHAPEFILDCKLLLFSYQRTKSYGDSQLGGTGGYQFMEFCLVDGRRRWLSFIRFLQLHDCVVRGFATLITPNGTRKHLAIAVNFQHQTLLPCPPDRIRVDVI